MGVEIKRLIRVITQSGLAGLLVIWGALPAIAGGFTQPKGFTFTSFSFSTFDTDSFHKQEIQFYLEHGLQEYVTLIFKSPYTWSEDNGDNRQGFSDQELGLRWRFNRDPVLATAIQGNLILPLGYEADEDPSGAGNQTVGIELSLPVSRGFQVGQQRYGYGTVEVGYRDYLGPPSDELRLSGEVSVDVVQRLAIATQFFGIYRLQSAEDDFSKLGGQLRWGANDRLNLVVGGFKNLSQEGGSFEVQIWYTFGSRRPEPKPIPPTEPVIP
jgi:hypothetical protein